MEAAFNYQKPDIYRFVDENFWLRFQAETLKHTGDLQTLEAYANTAMPALQQYLSTHKEYQAMLHKIQHEEIEGYSFSLPIFENNNFRINLNAIKPEQALPLHDHPDSAGITYIVAGQANIILCDANHADNKSSQSSLAIQENKTFSAGETSSFTKDKNNIHAINAISERCMMLVVHTNTAMTNKQSFFFSANKEKNIGIALLTQRLSRQTFKNFRKNKFQKSSGSPK